MIEEKKKLSDEKLEDIVGGIRMSQTEVGITPHALRTEPREGTSDWRRDLRNTDGSRRKN